MLKVVVGGDELKNFVKCCVCLGGDQRFVPDASGGRDSSEITVEFLGV